MMKKLKAACYLFFLLPVLCVCSYETYAAPKDLTGQLMILGKPVSKGPYANNIWDLAIYQNRLYIGHGNSSNLEPEPNAGPVPIYYYDFSTRRFHTDGTIDEEQIDIFRATPDQLMIPGHDPEGRPSHARLYIKNFCETAWQTLDTLPMAFHVYDAVQWQGRIYAALGPYPQQPSILVSKDNGYTWHPATDIKGLRCNYFFSVGNHLFASYQDTLLQRLNTDGHFISLNVWPNDFFPDGEGHTLPCRIVRAVSLNDHAVYIGGTKYNDHMWQPFGVFAASTPDNARKLDMPAGFLAWDLISVGKRVFMLTAENKLLKSHHFRIHIFEITPKFKIAHLFSFKHPAFARSFEYYQGTFYFGMGTDTGRHFNRRSFTKDLIKESGQIIAVDYALPDFQTAGRIIQTAGCL